MKFKFRLQKVLNLKQLEVGQKQRDLAVFLAQLRISEKKLMELQKQRTESFVIRAQDISLVTVMDEFLKGQDLRIENQKKQIKQDQHTVEQARKALIDKDQEVKILDKMHEIKKIEHQKSEDLKEQNETQEWVTANFKRERI
jgi:flagellar export protein FliJ